MKEKKVKNIHVKMKKIWRYIFFLGSMLLLLIGYQGIKKIIRSNYSVIEDDFSWVYQIDSMTEKEDKFYIKGWAFRENLDARKDRFDIILCDVSSGDSVVMDIKYESRVDVNNLFLCEWDYTESGFIATIDKEKIDSENCVYELLLQPKSQRSAYKTNVFFHKGQISFTNPIEFIPLDTTGTDLELISQEGILRGYLSDVGVYIYQYDKYIYWIMDKSYTFNAFGNAYVQYQLYTNQPWNLPEERQLEGKDSGYMSFQFKENELTTLYTGIYRVAKEKLPQNYSITSIKTGVTTDEWLWKYTFRPWYEYD